MSLYPARIDNIRSLPQANNNNSPVSGIIFNKLREAILQIETELGIKPSGPYTTVQERFFYLESIVGNLKIIELRGDLGGTLRDPRVIQLQGRPLSSVEPKFNEVLSWNGIAWIPQTNSASFPPATSAGQVILWDGQQFISDFLTQDDILPGYRFDLLVDNSPIFFRVGETCNPVINVYYDLEPDSVIVTNSESLPAQDATAEVIADQKITSTNSYVKTSFNDVVTLTVYVSKNRANKSVKRDITWGQPIFWGTGLYPASPSPLDFQNFLDGLTGSAVTNKIDKTFQVISLGSSKVYFACRSDYGNALFYVNGIGGGFSKIDSQLYDNGYGYTELFDLYESDNANLGHIAVTAALDPIV